jgi:hypothetical protein
MLQTHYKTIKLTQNIAKVVKKIPQTRVLVVTFGWTFFQSSTYT